MGKSKKDTVKLKRNGVKKTMPKAQWDAMKNSNNTYGWVLASEVSEDTKNKEQEIENSKITELEGKVKALEGENETLSEENTSLKSEAEEKDGKITELEGKVKALEGEVSKLQSANKPADKPKSNAKKS